MLAWIILVLSGLFEAVWATALGKSNGFTKLWPTVTFFVACVISMGGLAYALREIPTGTGSAVLEPCSPGESSPRFTDLGCTLLKLERYSRCFAVFFAGQCKPTQQVPGKHQTACGHQHTAEERGEQP